MKWPGDIWPALPRGAERLARYRPRLRLVGCCKLKPVESRPGGVESAWFQRLKLTYDALLSNVAAKSGAYTRPLISST